MKKLILFLMIFAFSGGVDYLRSYVLPECKMTMLDCEEDGSEGEEEEEDFKLKKIYDCQESDIVKLGLPSEKKAFRNYTAHYKDDYLSSVIQPPEGLLLASQS